MKNLIEILTEQTQSLKKQYLDFTEKYANDEFAKREIQDKFTTLEWYDFFGVEHELQNFGGRMLEEPKHNASNHKRYTKMRDYQMKNRTIILDGKEKFVAKELKLAEIHYAQSIEKLATRIEKKGLDQSKLEVTTSHIGVNINTTLTDGVQTVRAFTIIASGEIQRPHYRYLIK